MTKYQIQKEFQVLRELYQLYKKPSILIGGDFNMEPDKLQKMIKSFLEEFNLVICQTNVPTRE